jgi:hypothetical protein
MCKTQHSAAGDSYSIQRGVPHRWGQRGGVIILTTKSLMSDVKYYFPTIKLDERTELWDDSITAANVLQVN